MGVVDGLVWREGQKVSDESGHLARLRKVRIDIEPVVKGKLGERSQ